MSGSSDAGRLLIRIEASTAQLRAELAKAQQQVAAAGAKMATGAAQAEKAFDKLDAAATKARQAVERINAASGVKQTDAAQYAKRAADVEAYGKELDRLRAKFNPLFAAGQQYKNSLTEIAQAERVGAISANEAAAARLRLKKAFAEQTRELTGAAQAQRDLARVEQEAARAAASLLALRSKWDPVFAATQKYKSELAEIDRLEKAGILQGQALAAARSRAAQTDPAQVQLAQRAADFEAYGRSLAELRAKYIPLFAAQENYKKELGEIARAEKAGAISADEAAAARQRTKAAFAGQAEALTGVKSAATKAREAEAALAAAAEKAAQATAREKASFDALRGSLDRVYAAEQAVAKGQEMIAAAVKRGDISIEQSIALQQQLVAQYGKAGAAGVRAFQMQKGAAQNLFFQLNDIVAQAGSGTGFGTILIQQGPQIAQSLINVEAAATKLKAALTLTNTTALGVVVTLGALVLLADSQATAFAKLSNRLQATRNDYQAMARTANDAARAVAESTELSMSQAREAAQTLAGAREFRGTQSDLQGLIVVARDLARVMGQDVAEAAKTLATAMRDPAAVARQLSDSGLRTLDAALVRQIDLLQRAGDKAQAFALTLRAVQEASRNAADARTELEKLWGSIKDGAETAAGAINRAADALREYLGIRPGGGEQFGPPIGLMQRTPEQIVNDQIEIINRNPTNYDRRRSNRADLRGAQEALRLAPSLAGDQSENIRRLQARIHDLNEEYRGLVSGGGNDFLRNLRDQAELANAAEGAARELAQAEQQARQAGVSAAAARAATQQRLNNELLVTVEQTRREALFQETVADAWEHGARAAQQAERANRANNDASKYAVRNTEEWYAAGARLAEVYDRVAAAQERIRNSQAINGQNQQIELLQTEARLVAANVDERERELAALRERNAILSEGGDIESDQAKQRIENARRVSDAQQSLERQKNLYDELGRIGEQAFDRIGSAITEAFTKGEFKAVEFRNVAKAVLSEIAQAALKLAVVNPALNAMFGGTRASLWSGGATGAASAAGTAAAGGSGAMDVGSLGGLGRLFNGGLSAWTAPGYQFNTGLGFADSALNYQLLGDASAGLTLGQAGAGALGIAGGAYGIYSGLQTGGARGSAQMVGGAAGIAGGASGLAVASGGAAALGAGAAAALGAIAAVAPYIAAIAAIAAMFLPGQKPSNGAVGGLLNLQSGQSTILQDGGGATQTMREARDQLLSTFQRANDSIAALAGVRAQGTIGFEMGQRDPGQMWFTSATGARSHVGSAGVGNTQELTAAFEKALLTAYRQAPDMAEMKRWAFQVSGSLEQAAGILGSLKTIADTYGEAALNPGRNALSAALVGQGHASGNLDTVVAAIELAARLTRDMPALINDANALAIVARGGGNIEKIAADLQWLVEVYQPLSKAPKQVSALQESIDALTKTYDAAIEKARTLGLSETDLTKRRAEQIAEMRKAARETYRGALRETAGLGVVNQIRDLMTQSQATRLDARALGIDGSVLYRSQVAQMLEGLDYTTLNRALRHFEDAGAEFAGTVKVIREAIRNSRTAARAEYDAAMRGATGLGAVNQVLNLRTQRDASAAIYRAAGRDPQALYTAQLREMFDGLQIEELARIIGSLRPLDGVAASLAEAALASKRAAEAQQEAADKAAEQVRYGEQIRAYIDRLRTATGAGNSPSEALRVARGIFTRDLRLGNGGDTDALGRITTSADALLQAGQQMYASGPQYQQLRQMVIDSLTNLPAVKSWDEKIHDALVDLKSGISVEAVIAAESALQLKIDATLEKIKTLPAASDARTAAEVTLSKIKGSVETITIGDASNAAKLRAIGVLSKITGAVEKISLDAQILDNTKAKANQALAKIAGVVEKIAIGDATDAAKLRAIGILGKITGYVETIAIGDASRAAKERAIGVLGRITGYVESITLDPQIVGNTKAKATAALSTIAAAVSSIATAPALTDAARATLTATLSNLSATVTTIAKSKKLATAPKNDLLDFLGSLAAVVGVTTNLAAVPAPLRDAITNTTGEISRTLSLLATGGTLTADQRRHLDAELGTLDRTINQILTGVGARALTAEQRAILMALDGDIIRRTIDTTENYKVGTVDPRSPQQIANDRLLQIMNNTGDCKANLIAIKTHASSLDTRSQDAGVGLKVKSMWRATGASTTRFALGGAFGGGDVLDVPTYRPMALMGEAGPEGVLPLRRGPGGRLGVEAVGGGSDGAVVAELREYRRQSAAETMALRDELRGVRAELSDMRAVQRRVAAA